MHYYGFVTDYFFLAAKDYLDYFSRAHAGKVRRIRLLDYFCFVLFCLFVLVTPRGAHSCSTS
jgi:hypothetical protein